MPQAPSPPAAPGSALRWRQCRELVLGVLSEFVVSFRACEVRESNHRGQMGKIKARTGLNVSPYFGHILPISFPNTIVWACPSAAVGRDAGLDYFVLGEARALN